MVQSVSNSVMGGVLITLVNSGNTPAQAVVGKIVLETRNNPVPEPMLFVRPERMWSSLAWLSLDTVAPEFGYQSLVGVIPPRSTLQGAVTDGGRLSLWVGPKVSNDLRRYVWGTIDYKDVFAKPHRTIFCFKESKNPQEFIYCSNNNEVD